MYCFCGGVASFNVFCVLVTYPPGRRPGGEFLAVHGTATELGQPPCRRSGFDRPVLLVVLLDLVGSKKSIEVGVASPALLTADEYSHSLSGSIVD
jgi:hypothetical protein